MCYVACLIIRSLEFISIVFQSMLRMPEGEGSMHDKLTIAICRLPASIDNRPDGM